MKPVRIRLTVKRKEKRYGVAILASACVMLFFLVACATTPPPRNSYNICEIFRENPKWYKGVRKSSQKWGVPISTIMAIIHQESRFRADAKPPRGSCLWIFPGPRPSSSYGYAQAKDGTWKQYRRSTGHGGADRDDFEDAVDFVGWYCHVSYVRCRIPKKNTYNLYLAYHEGHGGFNRKTYRKKKWLLRVARKVNARANTYKSQLASCEREFQRKGCCFLWPF